MIYLIFVAIVIVVLVMLWLRKPREIAFLMPATAPGNGTAPAALPVHNGLLQFYKPAEPQVKLDFPPKNIGCCPFSKPMSKALPMADVPMCLAGQEEPIVKNIATNLP
jgi:hypothetical protein